MSKTNFNIELYIIKQIAISNGYNLKLRDKMVAMQTFRNPLQLVNSTHKDTTTLNSRA